MVLRVLRLQQGIQFHCSRTIKRLEHRNQPTAFINQEHFSTPVFSALAKPRFRGLFRQVLLFEGKVLGTRLAFALSLSPWNRYITSLQDYNIVTCRQILELA